MRISETDSSFRYSENRGEEYFNNIFGDTHRLLIGRSPAGFRANNGVSIPKKP